MAYDSVSDRVVVYGGFDNQFLPLGDAYVLTFTPSPDLDEAQSLGHAARAALRRGGAARSDPQPPPGLGRDGLRVVLRRHPGAVVLQRR